MAKDDGSLDDVVAYAAVLPVVNLVDKLVRAGWREREKTKG